MQLLRIQQAKVLQNTLEKETVARYPTVAELGKCLPTYIVTQHAALQGITEKCKTRQNKN